MTRATTSQGVTTFAYDPLGRRIAKHSQAQDGGALREPTRTMYGWDGDTLALESCVYGGHTAGERSVHYVYERDSFVPLVQATRSQALRLVPSTDVKALIVGNYGKYDSELDPLWNGELEQEAEPFDKAEIAFYQCDHLGTPQELTDCDGKVAWSAQFKAWGEAKEVTSKAAREAKIRNSIRFQGQYVDDETGLHYNRHRYYDPNGGRFISQDPIRLSGGNNLQQYAPNPTGWVDAIGLQRSASKSGRGSISKDGSECYESLYRGDSRGGVAWMKSHGAREGGHMTALNQTLLPDQDSVMKKHARDSVTPPSPYISVTSDPRVAEYFATNGGTTPGIVYTLKVKCGRAKQNKFNNLFVPAGTNGKLISEAEWLIPGYIRPSEVVAKRKVP